MESIRDYLLGITAAALLCSILTRLLGSKGTLGTAVKLLSGVFMALTVVGPLVNIRIDALGDLTQGISYDASAAAADGENSAMEAMGEIIKEQTRAYILDKAESLGAELAVEITLNSDDPPVPCAVRLAGQVSPYAKSVLSACIAEDLGIGVEDQIWTG